MREKYNGKWREKGQGTEGDRVSDEHETRKSENGQRSDS